MSMPNMSLYTSVYRYGFQGQEKDDEILTNGNSYTAQYWQYDPRLGRRWNTDPMTYSWQSTYSTFNNNPIVFSDPLGLFGSRKEARKFAQKNRAQFKGGKRIRKAKDGTFVIRRNRDGRQFAYDGGASGYEFKKPRNLFQRTGDYFADDNNFSFGSYKPFNLFGVRVLNSDGNSAWDKKPFSKFTISASVSHTSNGFKNKLNVGVSSTCETCEDAYGKTSSSIILKPGTKLRNPSASDISFSVNVTAKLVHTLPVTTGANGIAGASYGPWSVTYNTTTKDLNFSFSFGKKKKGFGGKLVVEKKLQENTIFD